MQQNSKVKPLKQCSCNTCRSHRGTASFQFDRKQANKKLRRVFRDHKFDSDYPMVISMDRA